jgi:hypothetical protein
MERLKQGRWETYPCGIDDARLMADQPHESSSPINKRGKGTSEITGPFGSAERSGDNGASGGAVWCRRERETASDADGARTRNLRIDSPGL